MVSDFLRGVHYFLSGFRLIRQPELLRFVWIPMICNLILFIILMIFAAYGLNHFSHWVTHTLPGWLQWLHWVLLITSFLFSAIALIFISTFIVNLIAGPFNSLLAEKTLQFLNVENKPVPVSLFKSIPISFTRQMSFLFYYIPRALFYLILFLIPVVQVIATLLWFLFNGWVFTMQYLDFPMELYAVSIKQMRSRMEEKKEICFGFGSAIVVFAMIPLVNFIIVPVAVVGATLLYVNEFEKKTR